MATSRFSIVESYKLAAGDLVLLPFLKKTALFAPGKLTAGLRGASAGEKAGASSTVCAGKVGRGRFLGLAKRVDSSDYSDLDGMKIAVSESLARVRKERLKRVVLLLDGKRGGEFCRAAHEGAVLGGYCFDKYLKERRDPVAVVAVVGKALKAARAQARKDAELFAEVNSGRDIINEPGNAANPATVAAHFRRAGRRAGMRIEIWDRKRLEREKCGGVLAVGSASATPPRLVIGRYSPRRSSGEHLVLVGKGVTFDTGGYSLKAGPGMGMMKCDMGGASATFHAACAIARLKLPVKVTVITPLVENAIGRGGYRPGDILRTRSGRTVQVDNTDAEGRLILTDALTIAGEQKPTMVIDAATLTGACVVALGNEIAALYASDKRLARKITAAGETCGEAFWEMPLYAAYRNGLKTPAADIKNVTGDRWAGSITAALFLRNWAPEKVPWAHLDIAGTIFSEKPVKHLGPGAQGFAIKTLVELARGLAE